MTSLWYLLELCTWVYQGCFWHCIRHDKCCLLWQYFDIYWSYTFDFIKAVSDTVLDMINAAYYDKTLVFIGATFWEKLVFHHSNSIFQNSRTSLDINPHLLSGWIFWPTISTKHIFVNYYKLPTFSTASEIQPLQKGPKQYKIKPKHYVMARYCTRNIETKPTDAEAHISTLWPRGVASCYEVYPLSSASLFHPIEKPNYIIQTIDMRGMVSVKTSMAFKLQFVVDHQLVNTCLC